MSRLKKQFSRFLATIISINVMLTSTPGDLQFTYAEEIEAGDIYINTVAGKQSIKIEDGQIVSVEYGQDYVIGVEGASNVTVMYSTDYENVPFSNLAENSTKTLPGKKTYYILAIAPEGEHGGATHAIYVEPSQYVTPNGAIMDGKVAMWNKVNTSVTGATTPAEASYQLQLYKDGNPVGEEIHVESGTNTYDFDSEILANGFGDYTYKITAVAPAGQSDNYFASAQSEHSSNYLYIDESAPNVSLSLLDGKLVGYAKDSETGVKKYAFSTKANASEIDNWVSVDEENINKDTTLEPEFEPDAAGIFYFYAQNIYGVTGKSTESIKVTGISLKNYYNGGSKPVSMDYFLAGNDTSSFDLTSIEPARTGYTFDGWYDAAEGGNKITYVSISDASRGTTINAYGRWSAQSLNFVTHPSDDTFTYDGTNHTISATLDPKTTGTIDWKWYKKNSDETATELSVDKVTVSADGKSSTLKIKDVTDSGDYFASAIVSAEGIEDRTVTSNIAKVTVNKRNLSIKANDITISYGDSYPAKDFEFVEVSEKTVDEGLAENDDLNAVLSYDSSKTMLKSAYEQWNDVGNYEITLDGRVNSNNYNVVFSASEKGYIKVQPKAVLDETTSNVIIKLFDGVEEAYEYTYKGSDITPSVKVFDTTDGGNREITTFSVSYNDNVDTTTEALVSVEFSGNYIGTLTKKFTIVRKQNQASVSITNWTYGETPGTYSITQDGTGEVTVYYEPFKEGGSFSFDAADTTTDRPTNAGKYWIAAKVAACTNYDEIETEPVVFEIYRRKVEIHSGGGTWIYDGNPHATEESPAVWIADGTGFIAPDSYRSLSASETITNVGTKKNTIKYAVTKSTNLDNYEIVLVEGDLTVTQSTLPVPANLKWSDQKPGTLTWTAVTRQGTKVQYTVNLYRMPLNGGDPTLVSSVTTEATSVDFLEDIHSDSASKGVAAYAATIQVQPVYSDSDVQNYKLSNESLLSKMTARYTAKFEVASSTGVRENTAKINESTHAILFQGEKASLSATHEYGYSSGDDSWFVADENKKFISELYSSSLVTSFKYSIDSSAKTESAIILTAEGFDNHPVISKAEPTNMPDDEYKYVNFHLAASDEIGLSKYAVVRKEKKSDLVESDWIPISDVTEVQNGSHKLYKFETDIHITESGQYWVYVKDTHGNVTKIEAPFTVYEIKFDGNGNTNSVSMNNMYKIENTTIKINDITFVREGYSLKYWAGKTGVYGNKGNYAANANDTLVAQWSNDSYNYKVNYYYMNVDGTYPSTPENAEGFKAGYGTTVSVNDAKIQKPRTGFSLDISANDASETSYEVTGDNQVTLKVYYKRNSHTITYHYSDISGTPVSGLVDTYLYGQNITVRNTPSEYGYHFVGWNYGTADQAPATMPDMDLIFTGKFEAEDTHYYVTYYGQNIDTAGFGADNWAKLYDSYSQIHQNIYPVKHDDPISYAVNTKVDEDGFTPYVITVTYGNPGGTKIAEDLVQKMVSDGGTLNLTADSVTEAGDVYETYINVYCKRNLNPVTLEVYKDDRDKNQLLYTNSDFSIKETYTKYDYITEQTVAGKKQLLLPFGAPLNDEFHNLVANYGYSANQEENKWTEIWRKSENGYVASELQGYGLAQYQDWSTKEKPMAMVDGPVMVTREYVVASNCPYEVWVYAEKAVEKKDDNNVSYYEAEYPDDSNPNAKFFMNGPAGGVVTIGPNDSYTINYNTTFGTATEEGAIHYFNYYEYDTSKNGGTDSVSAVIKNTIEKEDELIVKIYFKRKTTIAEVQYDRVDESGNHNLITTKVSGKWGTSYQVDIDKYYDEDISKASVATEPSAEESENSYRKNHFLVSYYGRYYKPGSGNIYTPSVIVDTEEKLTTPSVYGTFSSPGHDSSTYLNINYSKLDTEIRYPVDIKRTLYAEKTSEHIAVDLREVVTSGWTITSGGVSFVPAAGPYKLRVANKNYIFENATLTGIDLSGQYPAGILYTNNKDGVKWSYESATLRTDLKEITITGTNAKGVTVTGTYYIDETNKYIYIADESNQFYSGNRVSFNIGNYGEGSANNFFTGVDEQVRDYATTNSYGIYWNGISSEPYIDSTAKAQTITFYKIPVDYNISYKFGSTTVTSAVYHEVTDVSGAELATKCTSFTAPAGKHITWYTDDTFTKKLDSIPTWTVNKSYTFVGRAENDGIKCNEYAFYAKFDDSYITKEDVDNAGLWSIRENKDSLNKKGKEKVAISEPKDIFVGEGNYITVTIEDAYYYIDGKLVCQKVDNYYPAFNDVVMATDGYETVDGVHGFVFDEQNTNNKLKGYITHEGIDLMAYYTRVDVRLYSRLKDPNLTRDITYFTQYHYNQPAYLEDASSDGYEFKGWKLYKNDTYADDSETNEEVTDALGLKKAPTQYELTMPSYDVLAIGQWVPSSFDFAIPYYFQLADGSYDRTTMSYVLNNKEDLITESDVKVTLVGTDDVFDGIVVYTDETRLIIKAVITEVEGVNYYYVPQNAKVKDKKIEVNVLDLVSASKKMNMTTASEHNVSDYVFDVSKYKVHDFSFASYSYKKTMESYDSGDKFTVYPSMELAYYYARTSNIGIRGVLRSDDGGAISATISQDAKYAYGEMATLETHVGTGYKIVGWYNAKDVLTDYPDTTPTVLDERYKLKDSYKDVTQIAGEGVTTITVQVSEGADYVCVIAPDGVVRPSLEITSARNLETDPYIYKYAESGKNSLSASLEWAPGVDHGKMAVSGYQWYVKEYGPDETAPTVDALNTMPLDQFTKLAPDTSPTKLFETGKAVGTYAYRCEVELVNLDNGRKVIVDNSFTVPVMPFENYTYANSEEHIYDGVSHESQVYIKADYRSDINNEYTPYYITDIDLEAFYDTWKTISGYSEMSFDEYLSEENKEVQNKNALIKAAYESDSSIFFTQTPSVLDVRNKTADKYTFYYYTTAVSPNYGVSTGSFDIDINPVHLTLAEDQPFRKVYDGTKDVSGNPADEKAVWEASDLYKFISNANSYYKIEGIVEADSANNIEILLGFESAELDGAHVTGDHGYAASSLSLTGIKVVKILDKRLVDNYNYVFDIPNIHLSAEVTPYKLHSEWNSATKTFVYDGKNHVPSLHIRCESPDNLTDADITVVGEQKNYGEYTANATIKSSVSYDSRDYSFDEATCDFNITHRYLKVYPKDTTLYYNGTQQTITEWRFESSENGVDYTDYTLPEGESIEVQASRALVNAGTYDISAKAGVNVFFAGTNITDNYVISTGSGKLTILKRPVIVSGYTAEDKIYDGNTSAVIRNDSLVFSRIEETSAGHFEAKAGLHGSDELSYPVTGNVTGSFENSAAENDKTVNLSYVGKEWDNYRLVTSDEAFGDYTAFSQKTTTANITQDGLYLELTNVESVYGEKPVYNWVFKDAKGNIVAKETVAAVGEPAIKVSKWVKDDGDPSNDTYTLNTVLDNTGNSDEIKKVAAGEYRIFPVVVDGEVAGITSANYKIHYSYKGPDNKTGIADAGNEASKLTINKRPVKVQAKSDASMTKPFDNTTNAGSINGMYEFVADPEKTVSGIVNEDSVSISDNDAAYNSLNVNEANAVNVTLCTIDNSNYELVNDSFNIPGSITKINATFTVKDKTITYGDAKPSSYEYEWTSASSSVGSTEAYLDAIKAKVSGNKYDCAYVQEAENANANAGTYSVTVSETGKYTDANVDITYAPGNLIVEKKTIVLTPANAECVYGLVSNIDEDVFKKITWTYSGFVYGETKDSVLTPGAINAVSAKAVHDDETKTTITTETPAGDYDIVLENIPAATTNYTFKAESATLTVKQFYIAVNGIEVEGKEYDGTVSVDPEKIKYENINLFYYFNNAKHSLSADDTLPNGEKVVDNLIVKATYDNPYAGDNKTVYLDIKLSDYLAARYILITDEAGRDKAAEYAGIADKSTVTITQKTAVSSVTMSKRPLKLKPSDIEIKYGETVSVDTKTGAGNVSVVAPFGDTSLVKLTDSEGNDIAGTDTLDAIGFDLKYTIRADALDATTAYKAENGEFSDVGTYVITIHNSDLGYGALNSSLRKTDASFDPSKPYDVNTNFTQNYEVTGWGTGRLTVVQNKLTTPVSKWSGTAPGTYIINEVSGVGAVTVDRYEASLYKGETLIITKDTDTNNSEFTTGAGKLYIDFANTIRENGAGTYSVKVMAYASLTNNEGNKNVLDSDLSDGNSKLNAAKVEFKLAEDDVTKAAYKDGDVVTNDTKVSLAGIDGGSASATVSYVFISGENDAKEIFAQWENPDGYVTGYKVSDVSTNDATLISITNGKVGYQVEDTSKEGKYYGSIKLNRTITVEDTAIERTVTLSLSKRPATAVPTLVITNAEATYMYGDEGAPVATVTTEPEAGDNVDASHYDYSYAFRYSKGNYGDRIAVDVSDNEWKAPLGLSAYDPYKVYVSVTARRKDNGESITIGNHATKKNLIEGSFKVKRGTPVPAWASVSANDWTYGDERIIPTPVQGSGNPGFSLLGTQTIYYKVKGASDATYTTNIPTEVGSYTARIHFAQSENFDAFDSQTADFNIVKAKLQTPQNVRMVSSSTAPYGLVKWDPVVGPEENAGVEGNTAGKIDVAYKLYLMYSKDGGSTFAEITHYVVSATEYDFTEIINENEISQATSNGKYEILIQAIVANDENHDNIIDATALNNCADSDNAELTTTIHIATNITSNAEGNKKVYDGKALTLTVNYEIEGTTTYQWTKNGVNIAGATGKTYNLYHVSDSGKYSCIIKPNGETTPEADWLYATVLDAKVTPREITIVSDSATKGFDNTPLTKDNWWILENNDNSISGNSASSLTDNGAGLAGQANNAVSGVKIVGTITRAVDNAPNNNDISLNDLIIKEADDTVVYNKEMEVAGTANYVIKISQGTLSITTRSLSGADADSYTDGITVTVSGEYTYNGAENKPAGANVTVTDSVARKTLVAGTDYTLSYANNIHATTDTSKAYVIITGKGDYSGVIRKAFEIKKRDVTITSGSASKVYDGTPLTKNTITADSGLIADDSVTVTYTGTVTNVLNEYGNDVSTNNTFTNIKITNRNAAIGDVTNDYNITPVEGTLKITKRPIEITSATKEWPYDGNSHTFKDASDAVKSLSITSGTLASGEVISSVNFKDSAKVTNVSDGNVDNDFDTVIVRRNSVDVTSNYLITTKSGKLSISQRSLISGTNPITSITITPPADRTYTGEAHTPTDIVIKDSVGGNELTLTLGDVDNGDFYISGYEFNTQVASGTEVPTLIVTGRGNYKGTFKVNFKINKANPTIVASNLTVTYDGKEHKITGATVNGTTHDGNLGTVGITYSSNNKLINIGEKAVTISKEATRNYNAVSVTRVLKVEPKSIETLILTSSKAAEEGGVLTFTYDGTDLGPNIAVKATLDGVETTLLENRDYTVTIDASNNKVKKAKDVDEYTIEVKGTGNYTGILTKTYKIVDKDKPQITSETSIVNDGIYCKGKTITVTDPNLVSVVVTEQVIESDGSVGSPVKIHNDTDFYGSRITSKDYTFEGSDYGSIITVVATDKSGNVNETLSFKVYKDHEFREVDYSYIDGKHIEKKAPCNHRCGAYDYIEERWGAVEWDYAYNYSVSTTEEVQSGVQGIEVRATYAKVELLQNGHVIATDILNCYDTCGVDVSKVVGNDTYIFATYDPSDSSKSSGSSHIPTYDEHGNRYHYVLEFTAGKMDSGEFVPVNDYAESIYELYEDKDEPDGQGGTIHHAKFGHKAVFSYQPECFDVPWKVTLKNLPRDYEGNTIMPDVLYVKVLYAYGENADDSETATGYQVITQHAGYGDLGVMCEPVQLDDRTATYSGSYPVWKYQGGTTKSYYHRIQVVGLEINGKEYNIENQDPKLKSINDSDHVNHTIYYIPGDDEEDNGTASGTILYELELADMDGAVVIFDIHLGGDFTNVVTHLPHSTIEKDNIGDPVTEDEIAANVPVRPNYEFEGWYIGRPDDSEKITSIDSLVTITTLYAHWRELVPPTGTIIIGGNSYEGFTDRDTDVSENDTFMRSTKVKVIGIDDDQGTGVINSGVKACYYYISDSAISENDLASDEINWTLIKDEITVPSNGDFIIYVKVVDNDGNVGYVNSAKIRWTSPPVIPSADRETPSDNHHPALPQGPVTPSGYPKLPRVIVPDVEPVEPTKDSEPVIVETGRKGKLEILVENEADNTIKDETSPEQLEKELHVYGELPKPEELTGILTEEELNLLDEGSDIIIRLIVDDTKEIDSDIAMEEFIKSFSDDVEEDKIVAFKSYINLSLEKSVDSSEWEKIHQTGEKVTVVINVPEGLRKEGETLYLVKRDGSGYILFEDMDDNPNTITILTDDFSSQYAIVSILDEEAAKAYGIIMDEVDGDCFWHWFILLTDIMFILAILLTLKKKKDDMEGEKEEEKEEDYNKLKKRSERRRYEATLLSLLLMVIWNILGSCWIELPASIVSEIVLSLLQYLAYKHKFKEYDEALKEIEEVKKANRQ